METERDTVALDGHRLWLEAEALPGAEPPQAVAEARDLARRLGAGVRLGAAGQTHECSPAEGPAPERGPVPAVLLRAEANGGAVIDDACQEAVALAGRTGTAVRFEFLGKSCLAMPGADPRILLGGWLREAGFPDPGGAARSRPVSFASPALSLRADAAGFAGDRDAGAVCDAAVRLSARAGTSVCFGMAGVRCVARPGDDPGHLEANWLEARRDIESPGYASATFPAHRGDEDPSGPPRRACADVAR